MGRLGGVGVGGLEELKKKRKKGVRGEGQGQE